jgi:membrane-associated phospholipid phosphatase
VRASAFEDLKEADTRLYMAIAGTPHAPAMDHFMRGLSGAANHSKLSLAAAAALALRRGAAGQRAAVAGLSSIVVTSAVTNVLVKPIARRRRPDRARWRVPVRRHVRMPRSHSFPSGHTSSAFAFATGVAHEYPPAGKPLYLLAALVAYSRVHTGVHYPGDTIVGALLGSGLAVVTTRVLDTRFPASEPPDRGDAASVASGSTW